MEIGDIIISVNGKNVDTRSGLQRVIRAFEPGETVDIEVARFGQRKHYKVKLAQAPDEGNKRNLEGLIKQWEAVATK